MNNSYGIHAYKHERKHGHDCSCTTVSMSGDFRRSQCFTFEYELPHAYEYMNIIKDMDWDTDQSAMGWCTSVGCD